MPQLVRAQPKACWIPLMADQRMQEWFAETHTPAVIYGNVYPGVRLPSTGIDYQACIRHATAYLLAKGHRRLALVSYDLRRAGEQESVAGFRAAASESSEVEATVIERPDDDAAALCRQVDRHLHSARPPTAFIICRTHHYATVATRVLETGRRVPTDVSLICRGEDPFLHFLSPTPAFYRVNVETLARTLFRSVLRVIAGGTLPTKQHRVLPQFIPGPSAGRAPAQRP
jgi:LacI family transcriptional regulator